MLEKAVISFLYFFKSFELLDFPPQCGRHKRAEEKRIENSVFFFVVRRLLATTEMGRTTKPAVINSWYLAS